MTLPAFPPLPLDIAPALPPTFTAGGRVYVPWIEGVEVDRDPIDISYNVTPRQTARGRTWPSGSGKAKPVQLTLRLHLEARSAVEVGRLAQRWRRVLMTCEAFNEGARGVYPVAVLSCPEAFGSGNYRQLTVTWLLLDGRWRLSPDDLRPTDHPLEATPGLYPLGLLNVEGSGPGYYDVSALGDATLTSGEPLVLTSSSGQTYTFKTIAIEVPSE